MSSWLFILILLLACDQTDQVQPISQPSKPDTVLLAAPDDEVLASLSDALLWNDLLVIVDAVEKNAKAYDPLTGALVHLMGRGGAGPGEFQAPTAAAVTSDGHLAVLDKLLMRVSFFDSDGSFDRSWGFKVYMAGGIASIPGGRLVISGRPQTDPEDGPTTAISVFSPDGELLNSFSERPPPEHPGETSFNTLMVAAAGTTVGSLSFTSNQLHLRDLETGREWTKTLAEEFYEPPEWPESGLTTPGAAMGWASSQMFALGLRALDTDHFAASFGRYDADREEWLYRWVILDREGDRVFQIPATTATLAAIQNGELLSVEIRDDGQSQMVREVIVELSGPAGSL